MGTDVVLARLRSRAVFLTLMGVIGVALASALVLTAPATWRAEAILAIDSRNQRISEFFETRPEPPADRAMVWARATAEIERLKAPRIALSVRDRLALADNPQFQERPIIRRAIDVIWSLLSWARTSAGFDNDPNSALVSSEEADGHFVQSFGTYFEAKADASSGLIRVAFIARERHTAKQVVIEVLEAYAELERARKRDLVMHTVDWLQQKASAMNTQLAEAERATEDYRASNDLFQLRDRINSPAQKLQEVIGQMGAAEADFAAAQARASQVGAALRNPKAAAALPTVMASPVIQEMRRLETEQSARVSDLGKQFGSKHPALQQAQANLLKSGSASLMRMLAFSHPLAMIWQRATPS